MKNRKAAFVLALCFISSMSFADSVTDAPLEVSDPFATVQSDQGATTPKRHGDKKKNIACATQQTAQGTMKGQNPKTKHEQSVLSQTDIAPTM